VGDARRSIPVVCDLTDAADTAEERIAEYRRLFSEHLSGRAVHDGRVRFRFPADAGVEAWVRDLASREQQCCGFFEFSVRVEGGEVLWDASVGDDETARAMLDEWSRLPETATADVDVVRDRWTDRGLSFVDRRSRP
jgi:hypothetical protein